MRQWLHTGAARGWAAGAPAMAFSARHGSGGVPSSVEPLIVGNTSVGVRDNTPYVYHRNGFIGTHYSANRPRANAGDLLALIDSTAAQGAYYFVTERRPSGAWRIGADKVSMATVSFNSFFFTQPVYEGDLILLESRVVCAGNTSLCLYNSVRRQAFDSPAPTLVGESYVTLVTVDRSKLNQAVGGVFPAVRLSDPKDIRRHKSYLRLRGESTRQTTPKAPVEPVCAEDIEFDRNKTKKTYRRMMDTVTWSDRLFTASNVNSNKAIFGGEVLRLMELNALHCGRVFTGDPRVYTVGMMGMTFNAPLFLGDVAHFKAAVSCVRGSTMLVNVRIEAEREGQHIMTNQASFIMVLVNGDGKPVTIQQGLDLKSATQEELVFYKKSRTLMEQAAEERYKKPEERTM